MLLVLVAAAEVAASASGSSRGERRAEVSFRMDGLAFGAAQTEGAQAPLRTEILLGAESETLKAELRVVPGSAGLFKAAGELGVHFAPLGLILAARSASLGRYQLRAVGARLEMEKELFEGVHAGAAAAAWALSLEAPKGGNPWHTYGGATLDWPESWELSLWVESVSLALAGSPQGLHGRAALGAEVTLGPVKLRAEAGAQRLFAEKLLLFDLTCGASVRFE